MESSRRKIDKQKVSSSSFVVYARRHPNTWWINETRHEEEKSAKRKKTFTVNNVFEGFEISINARHWMLVDAPIAAEVLSIFCWAESFSVEVFQGHLHCDQLIAITGFEKRSLTQLCRFTGREKEKVLMMQRLIEIKHESFNGRWRRLNKLRGLRRLRK